MAIDYKESRCLVFLSTVFVFCGLAAVLIFYFCSAAAREVLLLTVQTASASFHWKTAVGGSCLVLFLPLAFFASPYCSLILSIATAVWGYILGILAFSSVILPDKYEILRCVYFNIFLFPPAMELFAAASSAYSCRLSEWKLRYRQGRLKQYCLIIGLLCSLFVLIEWLKS